jgi:hypothetical protein
MPGQKANKCRNSKEQSKNRKIHNISEIMDNKHKYTKTETHSREPFSP